MMIPKPINRYRTSENGKKLVEHFEGRFNKAYLCPAGVWTIGIGHTKGVKMGDTATDEQIDKWFYEDIMVREMHVNDLHLKIAQNQFDALVSFVFNLGVGRLKESMLLKMIKVYPLNPEIRYQFSRWNKALAKKDGKDNDHDGLIDEPGELEPLEGLIKRRASEAEMYFSGNLELF